MERIYFDNAATSWPKPAAVYDAMDDFNRKVGGNPGRGSNSSTLAAGSLLAEAREALARLFNVHDSSQIAFAPNVTTALNIALKGLLKPGDHVITTSMEHNSIARPLTALTKRGVEWSMAPCGADGSLEPDEVRKALRPNTKMIAMLQVSNLTGTVMPVRAVGALAREHDVYMLVDSAQSAGILPIDVQADNIDILCFTGHKGLLGPQGTGGIYLRPDIVPDALVEGGSGSLSEALEHPDFMPDHLEAGTHNTPGICGLLAGVDFLLETGVDKICKHERELAALIMDGMSQIPGLKLYGPADIEQRTAVMAFRLPGIECGELSMALEYDYGILTRSGLHCAPLAHRTLGTLQQGLCRISPGYFNTKEQALHLLQALEEIARV